MSDIITDVKGWEIVNSDWKRIQAYSGEWFHILRINAARYECHITLDPEQNHIEGHCPFHAPTENELLLQLRDFVSQTNNYWGAMHEREAKTLGAAVLPPQFRTGIEEEIDRIIDKPELVDDWVKVTPTWSRMRVKDKWFHLFAVAGKWKCMLTDSETVRVGLLIAEHRDMRKCMDRVYAIVSRSHNRLLDEKRKELKDAERQTMTLKRSIAAMQELADWQGDGKHLKLEPPTASHFHKIAGNVISQSVDDMSDNPFWQRAQVFVLEHNWGALFHNDASLESGSYEAADFKMPFEECAFEFRISGRNVLVMGMDIDDVLQGITFKVFLETKVGWWTDAEYTYLMKGGKLECLSWKEFMEKHGLDVDQLDRRRNWDGIDRYRPIMDLCWPQIKAACIAMEAEVAFHDVIRQPEKLVRARIKAGKKPPRDFHIVRLNKDRARPLPRAHEPGHEPKWRVRLHFRRGHYRHYENHKTWIKWMLVGDPDLGFIEKEYRF